MLCIILAKYRVSKKLYVAICLQATETLQEFAQMATTRAGRTRQKGQEYMIWMQQLSVAMYVQ